MMWKTKQNEKMSMVDQKSETIINLLGVEVQQWTAGGN